MVGAGDVQENLCALGMQIIAFFRELMPLMMMSWSNQGPSGLPAELAGPNPPPIRALKQLAGFFEAEMRGGRVRRHDPEIVARSFLGGLSNFAFFETLFRAHGELPMPAETYVRGHVGLLWAGIQPAVPSSTKR
jgi:hypothetical protein